MRFANASLADVALVMGIGFFGICWQSSQRFEEEILIGQITLEKW